MRKHRNILTIITILAQALLIILINQIIFVSENLDTLKRFLPLVNLIILILTVLVLFSIKEIGNSIKRETETNLFKSHLKQIEELVTTLRVQKHEYAKHIQTIQAMLYLDEINSAKEYINGISKNYRHSENIIYTDNPALTALLNSKRKIAENHNIDFDFAIKCDIRDINIPSWDLCSIIGNLLENSIEAVVSNKNNKNIGLEIKEEDKKHKIYVYNNGSKISTKEQNLIFKEGYTTKGSKSRGYGLQIVKTLVEQYKGEIEIKSDKKTTFIISFSICKEGVKNG